MISATKIAETLGGRSVLRERLADYTAVIHRARAGLPFAALEAVAKRYEVPVARLAQVLGLPPRTLARRKKEQRLSAEESDRLVRLARVAAVAEDVLETREIASEWLRTPNSALGGHAPFDQLGSDLGAEQVETLLVRIDHGVYS
ncbi:MAG TPA: antitoxin Xre-like helix-turn-helix domain-containing protein [Methylomirabilota bacterium]|nr:antitoxin Xre-like helix-turn-helix domain-containing protein [Methylomirabilota bacterium]